MLRSLTLTARQADIRYFIFALAIRLATPLRSLRASDAAYTVRTGVEA